MSKPVVTPGVSSTIEILLPANALNSVDFPTFGRPTTATTGLLIISSILYCNNFIYKVSSL